MDAETFETHKAHLLGLCEEISASKRPAYTQAQEDVLHNFKSSAARYNVTPLQAWGVQFDKQILSISTRVGQPQIKQAETMEQRFADAINYLVLGYALLMDGENNNG
jgi:hypothetical protein